MSTITIRLPGVPVGKGRARFPRAGHAYTPQKTRSYEASLRIAVGEAMSGTAPIEGPVSVEITATFPIPKSWSKKRKARAEAGLEYATGRPDADNLVKTLDASNEIVFHDDRQILRPTVTKVYGTIAEFVVAVAPIPSTGALQESLILGLLP
jgi:Holliday junction resolvase RusA-like endonuclease